MTTGHEAASTVERETTGGMTSSAFSGVAWTMSQQWAIRITGFITVAILARLLSPADFGVVALAVALLPLVQLLADAGFPTYLIQADQPTQKTYSTAFWYSMLVAFALTGLLILLAPVVGGMLGTPEAVPVIRVIALIAPITMLGLVPNVLLRRAMRFRALALQAIVAGLVGQAVAVAVALSGFGVWALVWQAVSFQIVATTMLWWAARWRPVWAFSGSELLRMMRFGVKVVAAEFTSISRVWLENVIVVTVLGTTGLGYLSIAQRLVLIAHELTTNALAPVSMVVFTKIRVTAARLREGYLRAQYVAHALVIPLMLFLVVGSPLLIPFFFGPQWGASIAPAQVLALAGILTMSGLDKGLLLGLGRPGIWLAWVVAVDAATVLTTYLLAPRGLLAIATGFLAVAALATVSRWIIVARLLDARWWRVSAPLTVALVPALGASIAGFTVRLSMPGLPAVLVLAAVGVAMMAVYLPLVRWALPGVWRELRGLALARVSGRGRRS